LIDWIQEATNNGVGIIINPAAYEGRARHEDRTV